MNSWLPVSAAVGGADARRQTRNTNNGGNMDVGPLFSDVNNTTTKILMMGSFLKRHKYLIIIIVFLLLVYIAVPSINYTNCRINKRFQKIAFDGRVVKKYLDKANHSQPKVEILNVENNLIKIYLYNESTRLFDKIQADDTLRKESGSNEIHIKIAGNYVKFGSANFNCDSSQLNVEKYLGWLYELVGTIQDDKTIIERPDNAK